MGLNSQDILTSLKSEGLYKLGSGNQKGTDSASRVHITMDPSGHLLLFAAMEEQHLTSHSIQRVADDDGPLLGGILGRRNATVSGKLM